MADNLVQMIASLAAVLVLIFVLAWLVRVMQQRRIGGLGAIRVHAALPVGARERVMLVEAAGQWLLVGVTPNGLTTLHTYATPPDLSDAAAAPTFGAVLKRQAPTA